MFTDEFFRDFFGMGSRTPFTDLRASYGRETVEKALELAKGQPPEANLMPYIQIVMDARRLGLEISRPPSRRNV